MALRTATRQRRPLLVSCASSRPCFGDQLLSAESTPEDPTLARRDAKSHNINPSVLIHCSRSCPLSNTISACPPMASYPLYRWLACLRLPTEGDGEDISLGVKCAQIRLLSVHGADSDGSSYRYASGRASCLVVLMTTRVGSAFPQ
ncbi:hypothetical protein BDZ90DRAFT_127716 [Jaminaea rosea]|uniref:Uncharacterized protein n=1 Tax=Jaminaea rosea TaxID=1569628 RepID=A0A316UGM6_9BASI|nr:hypothetical protein BDZ90DRAFT_127716 [Jaminaea rosea]PWN24350.1 hypothetical protein BDZ90DRAFT_127716 [Jaminaea rosea]